MVVPHGLDNCHFGVYHNEINIYSRKLCSASDHWKKGQFC